MLKKDQSQGGFPVLLVLFLFFVLVLSGGFLDQSHAGTSAFVSESQGGVATGLAEPDSANIELAESSQGNEVAEQTYSE